MTEPSNSSAKCGKKTNNPFFNFLRCYRSRPDRQHKSAVENAVHGAREWNKMNEEQRKPFVEMAVPFLKPEKELKYPRRSTVGRKPRRRRRTARSRARVKKSTARTKRSTARSRSRRRGVKKVTKKSTARSRSKRRGMKSTARSRSRRRGVKSRAPSRRRKARTTTTKRRTRSRGAKSRSRAKRRTQSCAKPFADQMNQQQSTGQEIKTETDRRSSMQHPTCPKPQFQMMQHQPTPAPGTSPGEVLSNGTKSACEFRNKLSKDCEQAMETLHEVTYKLDKPCKDCGSFGHIVFNDCSRQRSDCSCPCCLPPSTDSSGSSSSGMHVNCNCKKIARNYQNTSDNN